MSAERQLSLASRYLAVLYTERLADEGAVASVGSRGDSYDNALAATVNGLYKTEVIRRRGPWRTVDDVELATLTWVDWFQQPSPPRSLPRCPSRGVRSDVLKYAVSRTRGVKNNPRSLHQTQSDSVSFDTDLPADVFTIQLPRGETFADVARHQPWGKPRRGMSLRLRRRG
jgi:hypothetical protein